MNMTKQMKKLCLNPMMQAAIALPIEVRNVLAAARSEGMLQYLVATSDPDIARWDTLPAVGGHNLAMQQVYRIHPDTPVERSYVEREVRQPQQGARQLWLDSPTMPITHMCLTVVIGMPEFAGIIYEKDGKETLRPHLSLDFGTPKRVRFYTE